MEAQALLALLEASVQRDTGLAVRRLQCTIPGYIPARLYQTENYPIPRVIFMTWFDRRIGMVSYTSMLTVINHNPEYEFVIFDDTDVERFICDALPKEFESIFSIAKAGAMRTDIWRLLVIQKYGGVYLDSDISSHKQLPIQRDDTAVSGVAGWSHLPSGTAGALEHWAIAFQPNHPFINNAVETMSKNLRHPEYLSRSDTPEAKAEESVTMRLTGPQMYQATLHKILKESRCQLVDNSYCDALWNPEEHCKDMKAFRRYFPPGQRFFRVPLLDNSIQHKLFYGSAWDEETRGLFEIDGGVHDYDNPLNRIKDDPDLSFCNTASFEQRTEAKAIIWKKMVKKRQNSRN